MKYLLVLILLTGCYIDRRVVCEHGKRGMFVHEDSPYGRPKEIPYNTSIIHDGFIPDLVYRPYTYDTATIRYSDIKITNSDPLYKTLEIPLHEK